MQCIGVPEALLGSPRASLQAVPVLGSWVQAQVDLIKLDSLPKIEHTPWLIKVTVAGIDMHSNVGTAAEN